MSLASLIVFSSTSDSEMFVAWIHTVSGLSTGTCPFIIVAVIVVFLSPLLYRIVAFTIAAASSGVASISMRMSSSPFLIFSSGVMSFMNQFSITYTAFTLPLSLSLVGWSWNICSNVTAAHSTLSVAVSSCLELYARPCCFTYRHSALLNESPRLLSADAHDTCPLISWSSPTSELICRSFSSTLSKNSFASYSSLNWYIRLVQASPRTSFGILSHTFSSSMVPSNSSSTVSNMIFCAADPSPSVPAALTSSSLSTHI